MRKRRRTWGQRAVIAFNSMVALACFVAAVTIWYGNDQLGRRKQVDISSSGAATTVTTVAAAEGGGSGGVAGGAGEEISSNTFPVTVDAEAKNFLLTGSDNRACIDPNSPYAGAFLGTESGEFGERSDTIMILRVDPATNQAAVLSFPRDLWVSIAGSNRKSRINAAFDTENPTKLIDTIWDNFEVPIDHYINVDFCAFKGVVDAVGGVAVPFEFAARDKNTGLNIPGPQCHVFEGDEALAYVRSRHYQWFNPETNKWVTDGTSDYGRITRQQDFLKRAFAKAIDRGARNPLVAQELLNTMKENVTTDRKLTLNVMLQLAGAMQNFDPETVSTFQIEGRGVIKGNAQVIEPSLNTDTMKAVLAVFRGQARLADAPTATTPGDVATTLPTSTPAGSTSTTTPDVAAPASTSTTIATSPDDSTTETTVVVTVDDMSKGFYPPDDPSCH
ncbi:MAG: LCP family protein [Ilumatobacteraceae bacterium]